MSTNWDEAAKLLHIADLAHKWPKLHAIRDAALRELDGHAEIAAKDNAEAVTAKAKAETEARARAEAKARAVVEEEEAKAKLTAKPKEEPKPLFTPPPAEENGELKRRTLSE